MIVDMDYWQSWTYAVVIALGFISVKGAPPNRQPDDASPEIGGVQGHSSFWDRTKNTFEAGFKEIQNAGDRFDSWARDAAARRDGVFDQAKGVGDFWSNVEGALTSGSRRDFDDRFPDFDTKKTAPASNNRKVKVEAEKGMSKDDHEDKSEEREKRKREMNESDEKIKKEMEESNEKIKKQMEESMERNRKEMEESIEKSRREMSQEARESGKSSEEQCEDSEKEKPKTKREMAKEKKNEKDKDKDGMMTTTEMNEESTTTEMNKDGIKDEGKSKREMGKMDGDGLTDSSEMGNTTEVILLRIPIEGAKNKREMDKDGMKKMEMNKDGMNRTEMNEEEMENTTMADGMNENNQKQKRGGMEEDKMNMDGMGKGNMSMDTNETKVEGEESTLKLFERDLHCDIGISELDNKTKEALHQCEQIVKTSMHRMRRGAGTTTTMSPDMMEEEASMNDQMNETMVADMPPPCFFKCVLENLDALDENSNVKAEVFAARLNMAPNKNETTKEMRMKLIRKCAEEAAIMQEMATTTEGDVDEGAGEEEEEDDEINSESTCMASAKFMECVADGMFTEICPPKKAGVALPEEKETMMGMEVVDSDVMHSDLISTVTGTETSTMTPTTVKTT